MKRGRELESITSMAKCLMLLSGGIDTESMTRSPSRVFACKTCNRQFSSFQALGGHRASHKKPRLMGDGDQQVSQLKPKAHECSICGLQFTIGQALGGHMRRHRATAAAPAPAPAATTTTTTTITDEEGGGLLSSTTTTISSFPVLKRSSSRRVICPDLNLTPLENDLEFSITEKIMTPPLMIHCFI